MNKLKLNLRLSLRSKVLAVLTLTVVSVASIVTYFSSIMIIKDKRSYLFDTTLTSVKNAGSSMEQYFLNKLKIIEIQSKISGSIDSFQNDEDLFQIREFSKEDLRGYIEEDFYQRSSIFITQGEIAKLNISSEEAFLSHDIQKSVLYTNKKLLSSYKGRFAFLIPPDQVIKAKSAEVFKTKKNLRYLHSGGSMAPRYLYFVFDEAKQTVLVYDFLLDGFLDRFINQSRLETILVSSTGEVVFNNRAQDFTKAHERFFKSFIVKKSKEARLKQPSVSEYDMGQSSYIWASTELNSFPGYYLFSGISTKEAYQVTTFLVLTTIFYIIILTSIYGIVSIFLARSITRPLDIFIQVIQSISNGEYTARVGIQNTTELQAMATTFNSMIDTIQDYNAKLIQYNRTLEDKVEERTQKLKQANVFITTMINSLAQGLLVFQHDGVCSDLYTKACEKLLGTSPANKSLGPLIQATDENLMSTWIKSLFEEMIPFESLAELGPRSIPCIYEYKHKDFKHITLEFFPMRGDDQKIENVVMVATDKTREFKAKQQVIEEQNYVKLVTKVLKDKRNFLRFVDLFEKSLSEAKTSISVQGNVDNNSFLRLLHSMKGSAAFYNLAGIVNLLHEFETDVTNNILSPEEIVIRIETALELFAEQLMRLRDFISENKENALEIQESKLRDFYINLGAQSVSAARDFAQRFLMVEVKSYVEQYSTLVHELAHQLGKHILPVEIINGDLLVDMSRYQVFFDSCIHIFRNAVDHGMENPDERLKAGKIENGKIMIRFNIEDEHLIFEVEDDGRGISPHRIRDKMKELSYPSEALLEMDERIIYHIFDPSFSTASSLTDLSGRGVGLYDVQQNLSKLGGTIELLSVFGKGTVFRFYIPIT